MTAQEYRNAARRCLLAGLLVVASYLLAWLVCWTVLRVKGGIPDVTFAVGLASYLGYAKNIEFVAFALAFAAIVLLVVTAARVAKFPETVAPPSDAWQQRSLLFLAIFVSTFALLTFPTLQKSVDAIRPGCHATQYDSLNFVTWQYFRFQELVPFRDFWYPYGEFYRQSLPFPPDAIHVWLHGILLFGIWTGAFYWMSRYSKTRTALAALAVFSLNAAGVVQMSSRFMLPLDAILLFSLWLFTRKRSLLAFVVAFAFYTFLMEASQLVHVLPAAILLIAVFLVKERGRRFPLLWELFVGAVAFLTLVAVHLTALARSGALEEYLLFYRTLGDLATYTMSPSGLLDWFRTPGRENLLLVTTIALVAIPLWRIARRRIAEADARDLTALAIGIVTFVAYQKQLMRPHIAAQIVVVPVVGLLFAFADWRFPDVRWKRIASRFAIPAAGALLIVVLTGNRLLDLPRDIGLSLRESAYWETVAGKYFAPSTFAIGGENGEDARRKLLDVMRFDKEDDLFVLGDDPYLYILLGRRAPFYITNYNMSILYSQQRMVAWLEERRPKYVVWNISSRAFDAVPNAVRVPLVYNAVVQAYSPLATVGQFVILQRRSPADRIDINFWWRHLGRDIDLGYLPSRSHPFTYAADGGAHLYDVLVVRVEQPVAGKERGIFVHIPPDEEVSKPREIRFRERAEVQTYHVLLDRLWFWNAARTLGMKVAFHAGDPGVTAEVRRLSLDQEILY